jgi:hypothetical protein
MATTSESVPWTRLPLLVRSDGDADALALRCGVLAQRPRWLPSRLIPHRHCPRAELQPTHELQVDMLR